MHGPETSCPFLPSQLGHRHVRVSVHAGQAAAQVEMSLPMKESSKEAPRFVTEIA